LGYDGRVVPYKRALLYNVDREHEIFLNEKKLHACRKELKDISQDDFVEMIPIVGINLAKESLENTVGYSYHNTLSLSFNRIDAKFKRHNSTSNPESLNASINAVKSLSEIEETHL
jgi:hypothetical protein